MRRYSLAIALTFVLSLVLATSGAQALVVDMGAAGRFGVALVPNSSRSGISIAPSSSPCSDPWLSSDLSLPSNALCFQGGGVMHSNETFALTWDQHRRYWQTTRNYVEQFLSDVANGSGTLTSPYAVTGQYRDANGRAAPSSLYGGGCIDFGSIGGSACKVGSTDGTGAGHDYTANGCPVTGTNFFHEAPSGAFDNAANDICLTDAQLQQQELAPMIQQAGLLERTKPGYTPLVVLLTPPGVEVCLDTSANVCSANGASKARFCSYHSQLKLPNGTVVAYVVQPWSAYASCDDPGIPPLPKNPTAQQLATDVGSRLVSPLSQGHLAAVVNPSLNGWFALDGSEINDNGCVPFPQEADKVTVGTSSQNPYWLQREFNNAGVISSDPNALACTPSVALAPTFVVPSAVNRGDQVELDGSTTVSSLIVPRANYAWSFGDGTSAVGPSVVHSYTTAGTYTVSLKVTDRGGNVASLDQALSVLGPAGTPAPPPPPHPTPGLLARVQLVPQSLRSVLRSGVAIRVSSNERADAFATLSISSKTAKRAHIRAGRGPSVVIGRGTVSGISNGTVTLHLRLSGAIGAKLRHLGHVTLTISLSLVAAGHAHTAIVVAGRY